MPAPLAPRGRRIVSMPASASLAFPHLIGMERAALEAVCLEAGVKPVHAETLLAHLFRFASSRLSDIPGLPRRLIRWLDEHERPISLQVAHDERAGDGTRKLLLELADGKRVETVLIPGKGRLTQCVSTQVGCALDCAFCLTARGGLERNLSAAEMVAEVLAAERLHGARARNLVLMGMGEPMHNYDAVARFVRIVTDPKGMAFSPRRVTLSTAGHVPGIRRMIEDALPCNLALSLNATEDDTRSRIMPINRRWPIAEVLEWTRRFASRGRKRVLIEYVLLAGVNDTDADAERLLELLADIPCVINLLPFNPHSGSDFERPSDARVSAFRRILVDAGRIAVVRESRGREISAACGQLRARTNASDNENQSRSSRHESGHHAASQGVSTA